MANRGLAEYHIATCADIREVRDCDCRVRTVDTRRTRRRADGGLLVRGAGLLRRPAWRRRLGEAVPAGRRTPGRAAPVAAEHGRTQTGQEPRPSRLPPGRRRRRPRGRAADRPRCPHVDIGQTGNEAFVVLADPEGNSSVCCEGNHATTDFAGHRTRRAASGAGSYSDGHAQTWLSGDRRQRFPRAVTFWTSALQLVVTDEWKSDTWRTLNHADGPAACWD